MEKNNTESRMPQIGEALFCIAYLIFDLIAAIVFFVNANGNQVFLLFGILALVLGGGDAFHLVPRVIKAFYGDSPKIEWWSGLGLMVSSITMTVFYVLLFYIWKAIFPEVSYSSILPVLIWTSAVIRIILCLFPQNNWFHTEGNLAWGIYRNLPFAVTGFCLAVLFFMSGNSGGYGLWQMSIAIIISFTCYFPVVLLAKKKPMVGMLMIPKTIAYIWMISMGLGLMGNQNNNGVPLLETLAKVETAGWKDTGDNEEEKAVFEDSLVETVNIPEDTVADLAFAGDICLTEDGFVIDHYDEIGGDINLCLSKEIMDKLNEADISMINHEYPVSTRGTALEGKYYTFRANPEREIILQQMGIDIVSLANNHIYDFGADAFYDTLEALKQINVPYVGAGADIEEASRPVYFMVNGIKIGFVSANRSEKFIFTPEAGENSPGVVRMYDTMMMNNMIREAKEQCDYLIAYVHWGTEDSKYYEEYQTAIAREFFDSGADAIIGSHPHVLQGIGYVDGKPVVYSLGDFWFNAETKYTTIVNLKVTKDGLAELSVLPCIQEGYETHYISDESEQQAFYNYLRELSPEIVIDDNGIVKEKSSVGY